MKAQKRLVLISVFSALFGCATTGKLSSNETLVLDKKFFVVHYDPDHRLAKYVEYKLNSENLRNSFVKRKDRFRIDKELIELKQNPVKPSDYKNSGFQRGHLAPSGDFRWSQDANASTFVMSNITPQTAELNNGLWKQLEGKVRKWACTEGEVQVITGPVLKNSLSKLENGISIPETFFKIIAAGKPIPHKAIGFLVHQDLSGNQEVSSKYFPVSEIEEATGIDFFGHFDKSDQDKFEKQADLSAWIAGDCVNDGKGVNELSSFRQPSETCRLGDLKPADIRGCCSHHGGVMGPKKRRACCNKSNQVICNDGTVSPSCTCSI